MMKQLLAILSLLMCCCSSDGEAQTGNENTTDMEQKLYLTIGEQTMTATLVDNSSTEALVRALKEAPITYEAHDYGGFEKVGDMGHTFPQNNQQITTAPGDLILYLGSNLCIYYDTNSWNFTRIGRIDNATQAEVKQFVNAGGGNVSVTLSISNPTNIRQVEAQKGCAEAYTLSGQAATETSKGIIITNKKKSVK